MRSRETHLRLHRFRTAEKRRQVADITFMIQEFTRKFEELDAQVKFEETRTGISDPAHFSYSLTAKSARARRDNLMRSIADLRDQQVDAEAALAAEEQDLRRAEMMVDKDSQGSAAVAPLAAAAAPGMR